MGFLQRAIRLCIAGLPLAAIAAAPRAKPELPPRPPTVPATDKINVVLITGDDLGALLGCYGKPVVRTPNFDRLAARGIRFDRAYNQLPICNPSRASLFSGLTPERIGVLDQGQNYQPGPGDPPFMHRVFAANGYDTLQLGKIFHGHHDAPPRVSPKTGKVAPLLATDDPGGWTRKWDKPHPAGPRTSQSRINAKAGKGEAREYHEMETAEDTALYDGVAARLAAEQLQVYAETHRPFFMAVGFRKPHLPWHVPKKYFDLYKLADIRLPAVPAGYEKALPDIVKNNSVNDDEVTVVQEREMIRAYMACVSYADAQLGIILDAMDKNDLWKNTVFVVTGDHGFMLGEHGMWGKRTLFEESCRVPLMMAGAGIRPGSVSPRTVENLDIYPTLTDVCGLPKHEKLMGRSLVPLLKDPQAEWNRPAYTIVHRDGDFGRSIRTEKFRYTEWNDGRDHVELYDEEKDPAEYTNLAKDPAYAGVVGELRPLLHARKTEVRKLERLAASPPNPAAVKQPKSATQSTKPTVKKSPAPPSKQTAKKPAKRPAKQQRTLLSRLAAHKVLVGSLLLGGVGVAGVGFFVWRRKRPGSGSA
jgi:iduronate 2-sulfatase